MPSALRMQKDMKRKLNTRQKLLDASTFVFKKDGYHKTLISDIVKEAGVGQGTFYRYFKDKSDIFESLMEVFTDSLIDEFSDMSANLPMNADEYREASFEALERMAAIIEEHRDIFYLFLKEAPSVNKELEETIEMIFDRFAGLAKHYLDHAIAHGFARPCRTDVVSQSIVGIAIRMMNIWWNDAFKDLSMEQMLKEALDFAFMGLLIREDSTT